MGKANHGVRYGLDDPGRHQNGSIFVCVIAYDQEFVSPEPADNVGIADDAIDPLGDGLEDSVASVVAEVVVDPFESVEVKEEESHGGAASFGLREGVREPFA
jgi:hypothetical protein